MLGEYVDIMGVKNCFVCPFLPFSAGERAACSHRCLMVFYEMCLLVYLINMSFYPHIYWISLFHWRILPEK